MMNDGTSDWLRAFADAMDEHGSSWHMKFQAWDERNSWSWTTSMDLLRLALENPDKIRRRLRYRTIKLPQPMETRPAMRQRYYTPNPTQDDMVDDWEWTNHRIDERNFLLGLCYSTKAEAREHAEMMLEGESSDSSPPVLTRFDFLVRSGIPRSELMRVEQQSSDHGLYEWISLDELIPSDERPTPAYVLMEAFPWDATPQGREFWRILMEGLEQEGRILNSTLRHARQASSV